MEPEPATADVIFGGLAALLLGLLGFLLYFIL